MKEYSPSASIINRADKLEDVARLVYTHTTSLGISGADPGFPLGRVLELMIARKKFWPHPLN